MKIYLLTCFALAAAWPAFAQNAPASGKISYEVIRRVDLSQVRMVINGQEVRPGSADAPADLPETVSSVQHLLFNGTSAKEQTERPANMIRMMQRGNGGADNADRPDGNPGGNRPARTQEFTPPFRSDVFLNVATGQRVEVLHIRKDSITSETYRTDRPAPARPTDWQETGKTKKIAGYLCRKATASYQRGRLTGMGGRAGGQVPNPQPGPAEPYTIWYTTDLPFTYSPVPGLTPPQGVVLQIESDNESYKATAISSETVAADSVTPPTDAKILTNEAFREQQQKAMATFRQRAMNRMQMPR